MKGLAPTTINTLTEIVVNGNWSAYAGKVETLGLVSEDPTANYVQLAPSTQFGDGFTADDYAVLVKAMLDGTVAVSNDTTAMPATTNTNLSN
jgi:basic membrane protein A